MKPKRITKEQYLTLAQLKVPVYSSMHPCMLERLRHVLTGKFEQNREHIRYEEYAEHMLYFYTLVDSDEEA